MVNLLFLVLRDCIGNRKVSMALDLELGVNNKYYILEAKLPCFCENIFIS